MKSTPETKVERQTNSDAQLAAKVTAENPTTLKEIKQLTASSKVESSVMNLFGNFSLVNDDSKDSADSNTKSRATDSEAFLKTLSSFSLIDHSKPKEETVADKTVPGIRQGNLEDCHFVSSMQDVYSQPGGEQKLRDMIKPAANAVWQTDSKESDPKHVDPSGHYDKYVVNFPGDKGPGVSVNWDQVHNTDGAFDNGADKKGHLSFGENSRYPAILEVAAGKLFGENRWGSSEKADQNTPLTQYVDNKRDPAENMNFAPGGANPSLHLLTGKDYDAILTDSGLTLSQIAEHNREDKLITDGGINKFLYTEEVNFGGGFVGALLNPAKPDAKAFTDKIKAITDGGGVVVGAVPGHDYSILGVTEHNGIQSVMIKNPQHQHLPNEDPMGNAYKNSDLDSKTTGNAFAYMPIDEFMSTFTEVYEPKN